jgi:4'-phosphopantetheinyl transferase
MPEHMHITSANMVFTASPTLSSNEVHLWRADLESVAPYEGRWRALLSSDEQARADRFRFAVDRQRFTATRAILKTILAGYMSCQPGDIAFSYSEKEKPKLARAFSAGDIRFNVSHSGDVSLLAFSRGLEVGVDVEQIRQNVEGEALAARFFSASEQQQLANYRLDQRLAAFFRCWTRKEAYSKARGVGLSLALDQFDVSLAPGDLNCLLATRPHPAEARRWIIRDIPVGEGYAAALCAEGQSWSLNYWRGGLKP